jgi:hypothetical protein
MRDNLIPPPWFFGSRNRAPSHPARQVHAICNRAVWRSALPLVRQNADAVRKLTGKGAWQQFLDILYLAVRRCIVPKYHFAFELYYDAHKARAGDYLMRYETKQIAYRLLRKIETEGMPIKNKVGFAPYCAKPEHQPHTGAPIAGRVLPLAHHLEKRAL